MESTKARGNLTVAGVTDSNHKTKHQRSIRYFCLATFAIRSVLHQVRVLYSFSTQTSTNTTTGEPRILLGLGSCTFKTSDSHNCRGHNNIDDGQVQRSPMPPTDWSSEPNPPLNPLVHMDSSK
ncbi:hypothetical protein DY000_02029902 [Brassica cretica]|uniref:Uncharacterized protein n=1 Tax=Brassica cretica TaxID=69181 RepID=A0ABQ7DFW8_BRACR|nr:hypothetical protein DY000_02029902 [Brassica cretica]